MIEDNAALNQTMCALLTHAGHRVRAYSSGEELLADDEFLDEADCLLLDIQLPGMSGLDVLRLLQARDATPSVLVLTGAGAIRIAVEAMRLGAMDFIEKPYLPTALLDAVEKASQLADARRTSGAEGRAAATRLRQLSPRQRQVLAGIVDGNSNKIIAHQLNLSVRTVEAYRAQILAKLGARSTTEAVRMALASPATLEDIAA